MKKQLLVLCLIISSFCSYSQEDSELYKKELAKGRYKYGHVLLKDSTKISGLIVYSESYLDFLTREGTRRYYQPFEVLSIKIELHEVISDGNMFCDIIMEGDKVGLYGTHLYHYYDNPHFVEPEFSHISYTYYFKKKNGDFVKVKTGAKFRKTFSAFFGDCPDLKNRILKKELAHDDLEWIFAIYENCK